MRNRNDVLNEALCLIDDDLLARAMAGRSLPVAGRTKRFVRVFGRQLPAVVASIMAVAVVVVCLAAIPGVIRLMRLLGGMLPERPEPPVAGTVESAEITESAPELLPDSTGALMVNGKLIDCGEHRPMFREYPSDEAENGYEPVVLVPLITTLRALGIEISDPIDGRAEMIYFDNPYVISIPDQTLVSSLSGSESDYNYLRPNGRKDAHLLSVGDEIMVDTVTLFSYTLAQGAYEDMGHPWRCSFDFGTGIVHITTPERFPDRTGVLTVNGTPVDCGDTPPTFRQIEYGTYEGHVRHVVSVPLLTTLRALGIGVGPRSEDGRIEINYQSGESTESYELSMTELTLKKKGDPNAYSLLGPIPDHTPHMERVGDELMLDTDTLQYILYCMAGNRSEWRITWDFKQAQVTAEVKRDQARLHPKNVMLEGIQEIHVSSLPVSANYERTISAPSLITAIIRHIQGASYASLTKNPDEYDGMSLVITVNYTSGTTVDMISFGNLFFGLYGEDGQLYWWEMAYEDAAELESLLI